MADLDPMAVSSAVRSLSFTVLSTDEIKRQSVMEISNVQTFDLMGHPSRGGLYDGRMGKNVNFIMYIQIVANFYL